MQACDLLLRNLNIINEKGELIKDQAVAISDGLITWVGAESQLPLALIEQAKHVENCNSQLITPGLIDCHTHLVYAGNRCAEFQMKLAGMSYTDIAKAGGGILSTVTQTRQASEDELLVQSLPRITALKNEGVTTIEIKSGYGLDLTTELKMLRVARRLGKLTGIRVQTTFLGAHAVPPEFKGKQQEYVDYICQEMLPAVHAEGLADAVDVFCESIAFTVEQTEQIFTKAIALGLPIKCHAEQLSNLGASNLAAQYSALSSDHLEHLDIDGARAMAKAGTVAVLLPGAFYFLKEKFKPPVNLLREAGVGIAIATDCNPGSSPTTSLLLMMNMACQFFGLTVEEVLVAVTLQAATALGLDNQLGSITIGKQADLVLWSVSNSAELCYYFGYPLAKRIMKSGKWESE